MARVCMVAYTNYPADTRIRREAEALVERGDEVDIVCPMVDALEGLDAFAGVGLHTVMRFGYGGVNRPVDYVKRYCSFVTGAARMLGRLHRERRYDVIHLHTMPDFLVFSALWPKLRGARVVLDVHDLMPELYASKFGVDESHRFIKLLTAVERWSIRFADRAIAVHAPHLQALVGHGNDEDHFITVMNLPDPALFSPRSETPSTPPFTLIYHGMVGSRHGLDIAIRAVARARAHAPDLQLRIIGDGDFFPSIRALVEELEVQDNVTLDHGIVPIEQLLPVLRAATVGIVPILDDPFTRYMLPVKLLEYVSLGLPVIASSTETIRTYFGEHALCLSTPGDVDELAGHILELYRDPARRAALAEAARAFTTEHSWQQEKQKYYALIDELAPPVGAPARPDRRAVTHATATATAGGEAGAS